MTAGPAAGIEWLEKALEKEFEMPVTILDPGKEDAKPVRILNRLVEWVDGK